MGGREVCNRSILQGTHPIHFIPPASGGACMCHLGIAGILPMILLRE